MIKKLLLIVAVGFVGVAVFAQCCGPRPVRRPVRPAATTAPSEAAKATPATATTAPSEAAKATPATATTEAAKQAAVKLPRLVDLGAEKCIPCQKMAPILADLTKEYAGIMEVVFIDVWKPENLAEAKKYGIRTIPVQIFFDADGKELWRHEGFISKEDILSKWKELGHDMEKRRKEKAAGAGKGSDTR